MSAAPDRSIPYAINGLGRIGRALLRIARERPWLELVAINDLGSAEQLARLIARDTLHGPFAGEVTAESGRLVLDGRPVRVFQERQIERIPWDETEARLVVDATGKCLERLCARHHLRGRVRKVVVSANAIDMDLTVCMGVNQEVYVPDRHHLLSAASCTTNCLVPVLDVLDREFGVEAALLNTVHSYNNDQSLLEAPHKDPRRARAAALNMIPTSTSATEAAVRILPRLAGKLSGFAVRVPTPNVSLIDLVTRLERRPTPEAINDALRAAADRDLAGILAVTEEPLVSSDFLRDPHSAVVDLPLTEALPGGLQRVVAWYDNEWGHASRLADLLELAGGRRDPKEDHR